MHSKKASKDAANCAVQLGVNSFLAMGKNYYVEFITIVCGRRNCATIILSQHNLVVFHFIHFCLHKINHPAYRDKTSPFTPADPHCNSMD